MRTILVFILILLSSTVLPQNKWHKLDGPQGGVMGKYLTIGDTIIVGEGNEKALIYYSTNRRADWLKADFKLPFGSSINDFILTDDSGIIISVYFKNGLYKSFDLIHWDCILNNNISYWGLGKDHQGVLYAGTDNGGIIKSTNNGTNWNPMVTGLTPLP